MKLWKWIAITLVVLIAAYLVIVFTNVWLFLGFAYAALVILIGILTLILILMGVFGLIGRLRQRRAKSNRAK